MSDYARVYNNIVTEVIAASDEFISTLNNRDEWIKFTPNRNLHPGIGYTYDRDRDIFLSPKPYPSWVEKKIEITGLDENNNISIIRTYIGWAAPIPKPNNKNIFYKWDEDIKNWVIVQPPSLSGAN